MICCMKLTPFVVFLLLSFSSFADDIDKAVQKLESDWANIYYSHQISNKKAAYTALLDETIELSKQNPKRAEFFFWQAVIKATNAEHQDGISALIAINEARDLLLKAITLDPNTMDGSAFVTLGTLYYLSPGWPIAFGDANKAEKYLKTGLEINPQGIDSNYYYGDFLLKQNKPEKAVKYFKHAIKAHVRKEQKFADTQLKAEAKRALNKLAQLQNNAPKSLIASNLTPSQSSPR